VLTRHGPLLYLFALLSAAAMLLAATQLVRPKIKFEKVAHFLQTICCRFQPYIDRVLYRNYRAKNRVLHTRFLKNPSKNAVSPRRKKCTKKQRF
jgi:hypothetical protein